MSPENRKEYNHLLVGTEPNSVDHNIEIGKLPASGDHLQ
jgi:hypothetical protein